MLLYERPECFDVHVSMLFAALLITRSDAAGLALERHRLERAEARWNVCSPISARVAQVPQGRVKQVRSEVRRVALRQLMV
jgi:hypothetical protein